jgi:hypothetical protein
MTEKRHETRRRAFYQIDLFIKRALAQASIGFLMARDGAEKCH